MKTKNLIFLFLLVIGTCMYACTKDDSCNPQYPGSMSASVSGSSWNATSMSSYNDSLTISVSGFADDGSSFTIFLPSNTSTGNNTLTSYGPIAVIYDDANCQSYTVSSGSISLNSISNTSVSGSFSGSAPNDNNCKDVLSLSGSFTAYF